VNVAEAIAAAGIDAFEARLLLSKASGLARTTLIAHPETPLGADAAATFAALAARRRAGEPIAYLVGERDFHAVTLHVTPDVLIPRPETELLVEFALEHLPRDGALLDLGTGSGAIALAVRHQRPNVRVTAVDLSAAALAVARANAARIGLDVELLEGSWFGPLAGRSFDVIVSNPPYVAQGDRHLAEGDVRFEPIDALVSGVDGLDAIREIVAAAPRHLRPGGWMALEHGYDQAGPVRAMLAAAGLDSVDSRPDLAGIARISAGKYNPE
jgi:release factor glutamine methyltransferase